MLPASLPDTAPAVVKNQGKSFQRTTAFFWHPEDLGKEACQRIGRSLSDEEWDKYLPMEKGEYFRTCEAYLHSH